MELISYAKINIGLKIKSYSKKYQKHQIESLFLLVEDYSDQIVIDPIKADSTTVKYYQNEKLLHIDNDLVTKTIKYFQDCFQIKENFNVVINKKIPMGAGLGGSSSNAGSIINYLIKTYTLNLTTNDWLDIAINLGSDVTFFASGYKMALVSGYGHKVCLIDKPFPQYKILSNDLKCSTQAIYQTYRKTKKWMRTKTNFWNLIELLPNIKNQKIINDLQAPAFLINPQLLDLFSHYEATRKIFLTGSGSFFVELF